LIERSNRAALIGIFMPVAALAKGLPILTISSPRDLEPPDGSPCGSCSKSAVRYRHR
jgi:hypothetical protein